jgi:type I restriction enzyme M protein
MAKHRTANSGGEDSGFATLGFGEYEDVAGFCKSAMREGIRRHGHVLTPGRYVGAEATPDDGAPFEKKARLVAQLRDQQAETAKLDAAIAATLRELGYAG